MRTREPGVSEGTESNVERAAVFAGLSVENQAAPILKRTLAYMVDLGVVYAAITLLYLFSVAIAVFLIGAAGFADKTTNGNYFALLFGTLGIVFLISILFIVIAFYHGYFIYSENKYGYTLGKKVFGLKVISTNNSSRLGLWQCILRDMMRYIDALMIFPGLLSMTLSEKNLRLGDMMSNTMVVSSKYQEQEQQYLYISQDQYWRFRDLLSPQEVPLDVCTPYSQYAYRRFIKKESTKEDVNLQWEAHARSYYTGANASSIDADTALLFFAELCNQTVIGKR